MYFFNKSCIYLLLNVTQFSRLSNQIQIGLLLEGAILELLLITKDYHILIHNKLSRSTKKQAINSKREKMGEYESKRKMGECESND